MERDFEGLPFGYNIITSNGNRSKYSFVWRDHAKVWCQENIGYVPNIHCGYLIFKTVQEQILFIIQYPDAKNMKTIKMLVKTEMSVKRRILYFMRVPL